MEPYYSANKAKQNKIQGWNISFMISRFRLGKRTACKFTSPFASLLGKKIRTRASFTKMLANYTSEESLITGVYDKNII